MGEPKVDAGACSTSARRRRRSREVALSASTPPHGSFVSRTESKSVVRKSHCSSGSVVRTPI
eukprot:5044203-Prorocentrum_lima.AAC.1